MKFNSFTFLVFFLTVLFLYYGIENWRRRKQLLLFSSYLFYSAWNPFFIVLIWISTVTDWILAGRIHGATTKSNKKLFLVLSLLVNLGLLGYFKYSSFLLNSFKELLGLYGIGYKPAEWDIVLPLGISFYTFQTLSYTIDVYRNKLTPTKSLLDFSLYVTFFPQLVAGPIVRSSYFLPQCRLPKKFNSNQFGWGLCLLTIGVFSKVVLADGILAPVVDKVFINATHVGTFEAWVSIFAFSGQIFFDFSGYSTCAIGAALCMGFSLPDNFLSPYAAVGFSEFWKRWHISLSSWIRDYLYVPLGGNRKGDLRTLINLGVVMFLGGLWHGASWLFVLWGMMQGCYLVIEHITKSIFKNFHTTQHISLRYLLAFVTFVLISLSWVFFRSPDIETSFALFQRLFIPTESAVFLGTDAGIALLLIATLFFWHQVTSSHRLDELLVKVPWWGRASLLGITISLIAFSTVDDRAFIYFQF